MSKTILITGASGGMGRALVELIADEYDKIICHYRDDRESIDALAQKFGDKIVPVQADFLKTGDTQRMLDEIDGMGLTPDSFVHLSGLSRPPVHFHKTVWEDFEKQIAVTVEPAYEITSHLIRGMKKRKTGNIVFMLSYYVTGIPDKYQSDYVTGKYALLGLMRSLAAEYGEYGIRINAVSPAMTDTGFIKDLPDILIETNLAARGKDELLDPASVAEKIRYLLSEEAEGVNGENILID